MLSDRDLLDRKAVLRVDEAARILRCSVWTVYRMVRNGDLTAIPVGRAGIRIPADRVRELVSGGE